MDKSTCKTKWMHTFKQALDADTWGQSIEAHDYYKDIATAMENQSTSLTLTADEQSIISKLCTCLRLRANSLMELNTRGMNLEQIKLLTDVIDALFTNRQVGKFPIDLSRFQDDILRAPPKSDAVPVARSNGSFSAASAASAATSLSTAADGDLHVGSGSLLAPPTILSPGLTCLVFEIEKIGLKDADVYIDAFITVSVVDSKGNLVESSQDTPISNRKKAPHVLFGNTVYIQTPLEHLDSGFAIFFEFKHYKPSKKKISTRCYAFMEKDEVQQSNNIQLELYAKPTDLTRKDIRLFTVKQLYMHLKLSFRKT